MTPAESARIADLIVAVTATDAVVQESNRRGRLNIGGWASTEQQHAAHQARYHLGQALGVDDLPARMTDAVYAAASATETELHRIARRCPRCGAPLIYPTGRAECAGCLVDVETDLEHGAQVAS